MALGGTYNTIVHRSDFANFDDYTYTKIYSPVDVMAKVNGNDMFLPGGTPIYMVIGYVEPNANVFIMGTYHNDIYDYKVIEIIKLINDVLTETYWLLQENGDLILQEEEFNIITE